MRQKRAAFELDGGALKVIALVTMVIDHIGAVILQKQMINRGCPNLSELERFAELTQWGMQHPELFFSYELMRLIGRMSFPLFAFLLVEGFQKTGNIRRYLIRLGVFAVVSEVPFDLATAETILEFGHQNIFFTLFLGLLMLYLWQEGTRGRWGSSNPALWMYGSVGGAMILAELLRTDYGAIGILVIALLYHFRHERFKNAPAFLPRDARHEVAISKAHLCDPPEALSQSEIGLPLRQNCANSPLEEVGVSTTEMKGAAFASLILALGSWEGIASFLALLPIWLYNGARGRQLKYGFYAFYPVHLLVLYGIAQLI